MLGCNRIESNAFRLLRLSGRSTRTEIDAAAAELNGAVALGRAGITEADLAGIDAAVAALDNPRLRIEHRLFWFHEPACMENTPGASLEGIEAVHDDALRSLVAAYFEDKSEISAIASALQRWDGLLSEQGYWDALGKIESEGAFEPPALAEEISDLRCNAMALAAEPLVEAAQDSWVRKDLAGLRAYLSGLKDLEPTGEWASACRQRLICKVTAQLADACGAYANKYRAQITYRHGTEQHNEPVCLEELRYFRELIEPAWEEVHAALPVNETELRLSRGQAADCLASIAIDYTWAGKHVVARELGAEAISLATGTIAEPRIRLALSGLLETAERATECELNVAICAVEDVAEELPKDVPQDPRHEVPQDVDNRRGNADSAVEVVRQRCATLASTFAGKIVAKQEYAGQNRQVCDDELKYFREQIEPAFQQAEESLQPDTPFLSDLRETVAVCLANIATHHIWADELTVAEQLIAESLRLAQGTWAARSIRKKYLEIRASSGKFSIRKQDCLRVGVGLGAGLLATLLLVLVVNRPGPPSIAAAPRSVSDSLPNPLEQRIDQTTIQLKSLEPRIQEGRECAADLERKIKTLHTEIESLKEDRVAGELVDTGALNTKVHSYGSLLRASRKVSSEVDADVQLHDRLVVKQRLLLNERERNGDNAQ
jgi:hypothetical protein